MSLKIKIPTKEDPLNEFEINSNVLTIVGANGSGKSRLAYKIFNDTLTTPKDKTKDGTVEIIIAQRTLQTQDDIPKYTEKQLETQFSIISNTRGHNQPETSIKVSPNNLLQSDFPGALSKINNRSLEDSSVELERIIKNKGEPNYDYEILRDKVSFLWNNLFGPDKSIEIKNDTVLVKKQGSSDYVFTNMSDGEKSALYLICKILGSSKDIFIIDEPELSINKAIQDKLWDLLEKEKSGSTFIYITHDTDFATTRSGQKLWIKSYDKKENDETWDYEEVKPDTDLPEDLLLKVLGSRRKIVFCEGKGKNADSKLYSAVYPEYKFYSVGNCTNVINYTKAINNANLGNVKAFGLIDRDFRTDEEILELQTDDIYCLKVAQKENIIWHYEILDLFLKNVEKYTSGIDKSNYDAKLKIWFDSNKNNLHNEILREHVSKSFISDKKDGPLEIKNKLSSINIDTLSTKINDKINLVDTDNILKVAKIKSIANAELVITTTTLQPYNESLLIRVGVNVDNGIKEACKKLIGLPI